MLLFFLIGRVRLEAGNTDSVRVLSGADKFGNLRRRKLDTEKILGFQKITQVAKP